MCIEPRNQAFSLLHVRMLRLSLVVFKGELYAIGGVEHMEPVSTVEKYSPLTNSWRYVASLNSPRRSCTALVAGSGIFVLGGFSGSVFLKSVEFYNAELDEWQYQQPMIHSRSELTGVFFDQRIYAIGGQNSHTCQPSRIPRDCPAKLTSVPRSRNKAVLSRIFF